MSSSSNRSTEIHLVVGVFFSLAVIAVGLRLAARRISGNRLGLDDVLAILGLAIFMAMGAMEIWTTRMAKIFEDSRGKNIIAGANYSKGVLIMTILSPLQLSTVKFSVLALYWRIFSTDRSFRRGVTVVATLSVLWLIAATTAALVRCIPLEKAWNPRKPGKCYSFPLYILAVDSPNSFIDLVMVILPIRVIRQLQLPSKLRLGVSIIFVLGGFNGIIGFIRIAIVYTFANRNQTDKALRQLVIWLMIHLGTGIICCCLPTYRPLIPRGVLVPVPTVVKGWYRASVGTMLGKRSGQSRPGASKMASQGGGLRSTNGWYNNAYTNIGGSLPQENTGSKVALTVEVQGGPHTTDTNPPTESYPMGGITVQTDIKIT